jgi:hypothetical protein
MSPQDLAAVADGVIERHVERGAPVNPIRQRAPVNKMARCLARSTS